jgi:hypothetical protein
MKSILYINTTEKEYKKQLQIEKKQLQIEKKNLEIENNNLKKEKIDFEETKKKFKKEEQEFKEKSLKFKTEEIEFNRKRKNLVSYFFKKKKELYLSLDLEKFKKEIIEKEKNYFPKIFSTGQRDTIEMEINNLIKEGKKFFIIYMYGYTMGLWTIQGM